MRSITLMFLCVPGLALADPCKEEIAELFDGPLDPFQRPPHIQTVQIFDATGAEVRVMTNYIETPLRTIAGVPAESYFTMAVDRDIWNGPSPEGPWTANPAQMPEGREEGLRDTYAQLKANLTDTECHGADDAGNLRYTYRSQTDPDPTGGFFGSLDTVTVDAGSGQVIRFEMREFVNAWTDGVSKDRHVIEVTFDPEIRVTPPEG